MAEPLRLDLAGSGPGSACDGDDGQPAEFRAQLEGSDSADNLALLCRACVVAWVLSVSAGEVWTVERLGPVQGRMVAVECCQAGRESYPNPCIWHPVDRKASEG